MNTMFINIYYILDSNSLKYLIAFFFFLAFIAQFMIWTLFRIGLLYIE